MGRRAAFIALAAIVLVGAVLRLYGLWQNSPELFADEIDNYIAVRSIVTTGHDVDGTLQPFLFTRVARTPPLYGIAAYLSSLVFGAGPFGLRFPAALFGLASIVLMYLLVRELTHRREIALTAAAILAVAPFAVHFSRIGWEPATLPPLILGSAYALLRALRAETPQGGVPFGPLAGAAVVFALTAYSYPAAWLYAAILGATMLWLHRDLFAEPADRLRLSAAATLALALAAPGLLVMFTDPVSVARARVMSTFSSGLNVQTVGQFIQNYEAHFSWLFLFAQGDVPIARYLSGFGELYWWMAPLIVIGTLWARRYVDHWAATWLWVWLAIFPLGGSLTNDGVPHAPRTLAGLLVFPVLAALGVFALLDFAALFRTPVARRRYAYAVGLILFGSVGWSLGAFTRFYFTTYPVATAADWESGNARLFAQVIADQPGYVRACFNGFNYFHIDTLIRYYLPDTPLHTFQNAAPDCTQPGTLLVSTAPVVQPGFTLLSAVQRADGRLYGVIEGNPLR